MFIRSICWSLFTALLLWACEEVESPSPVASGTGFYPLEIGNYWIYEVQEIQIKAIETDSLNYQLRERITDSLVSDLGVVTYLINRDVRNSPEELWSLDSVWTVRNTGNSLVVTENNIPLIKLIFPVEAGQSWNGNAFNNLGNVSFTSSDVTSEELPLGYDSLESIGFIRTTLSDLESPITGTDVRFEIYGNGIGLIEKDYTQITLCTSDNNCDVLGDTIGGRILSQVLIEYGTL